MARAITPDEVHGLLMDACPSYETVWAANQEEPNIDEDTGDRLHYLDAGDFARHVVHLLKTGKRGELPAIFRVVERLHVEGDKFVQELATVGFLEGIQNVASHQSGVEPDDFMGYLGPESLRWWRGLDAFWAGDSPTVLPVDGEPRNHA